MIRFDDGKDPDLIFSMWQRNFADPLAYARFYFSEVYGKNEVLMNMGDDGRTFKGMLHLNPYRLMIGGRVLDSHYIVGVSTDEEYRRQGVMKELLVTAFSHLREKEEPFAWLMPADEDYYLPFDFRFGMRQIEQEIFFGPALLGSGPEDDLPDDDLCESGGFSFREELSDSELQVCADLENAWKKEYFDIATLISPDYLKCLEKEVKSDYGKLFYVFCGDDYAGRFALIPEYDCLIISRVFARKRDDQSQIVPGAEAGEGQGNQSEDFLQTVLRYLRQEYHYGNYQVILDTSFEETAGALAGKLEWKSRGTGETCRILPAKYKNKIMFRILDLEGLGEYLSSEGEADCFLRVRDPWIPEQDGVFHFACKGGRLKIKKARDRAGEAAVDGSISVADLTGYLFGGMEREELRKLSGISENGVRCLLCIRPMDRLCLMEIV